MRGGHVVRVARFADPEQQHRIRVQARPGTLEQRERRGLADGNTVARDVEGPARRARHQLQGVKAIERGEAQRVHPADERGVDQPRLDGAPRRGEHLGARGARARDHHGRARQPQRLLRERRERERVVRAAVAKLRRQRTAHRVALAVGELGLEDPRGAGAEKHPDALTPVALSGALHRLGKTVLGEAEVGQAIVAALELAQPRRQRGLIDARNLAHPGVEPHRLEGARGEPRAPLAQRGERGGHTATDAARGREAGERERIHAPLVYVSVSRHDPRPRAA